MRLRDIRTILIEEVPKLDVKYSGPIGVNQYYKVTSLKEVRESVSAMEKLGIFLDQISLIKSIPIFESGTDSVQITSTELNTLHEKVKHLKYTADSLIQALTDANIEDIPEDYISIKLPSIATFEELREVSEKLKKAIQLPVESLKSGNVVIKNFDSGSFWLDVAVGSILCVKLVGAIAWAGAVVYKKIQEAKMFESFASGLRAKNDHVKAISELAQTEINALIDIEAQHIKESFPDLDVASKQEEIERLKLSIKSMSELIMKGTEIQTSLNSPEDVKNLFPDFAALSLIESKVKQINNGN